MYIRRDLDHRPHSSHFGERWKGTHSRADSTSPTTQATAQSPHRQAPEAATCPPRSASSLSPRHTLVPQEALSLGALQQTRVTGPTFRRKRTSVERGATASQPLGAIAS